jgi:hypothetical protein
MTEDRSNTAVEAAAPPRVDPGSLVSASRQAPQNRMAELKKRVPHAARLNLTNLDGAAATRPRG